jgi:hypothetical protein
MKSSVARTTISDRLNAALKLPNGARFFRCALQVNPFAYLSRNSKQTIFSTEADYNAAIIAACRETGTEVIGVADHYRVQESVGLVEAARAAGLFAFGGFEAVTKDGVHFLCLFDPDKDNVLERMIGECGIHDINATSPTGNLDSLELLACGKKWGQAALPRTLPRKGGYSRSSPVKPASTSGRRRIFLHAPLLVLSIKPRKAFGRFWRTRTHRIVATVPSRS